jgi:tetratricopeptide (TPR) repeat protein
MSSQENEQNPSEIEESSTMREFRNVGALSRLLRQNLLTSLLALVVVLLVANLIFRDDASKKELDTAVTTTIAQSRAAVLVDQAVELITNKQYDTALDVLNQAIAADPGYGLTYYNQGVVFHFTGNLEGAVASYTKALSFNNKDASSYYNRGLAHRDSGKLSEAEGDLKIAVVMKPEWAAAKFNLGQVLMSLGKSEDGKKFIADARAIDPNIGN